MVSRRAFLLGAGAGTLLLTGPWLSQGYAADGAEGYLSACRLPDGSYAVAELTGDGLVTRLIPLPGRGHGFAISSDRRKAVAVARYPRSFAVGFAVGSAEPPALFSAPEGRHFYGHGIFFDNDRLVLATENDFDNARGVIGVYDVGAGYQRIGEIDTHGVGPHEVVLMPDGRTGAVANGGIETHPGAGEAKLNVADMEPSLAFLDLEHGDLITQHKLDPSLHQLSIRHLAVDAAGSVWFGCQYEGPATDQPPLIGRASPDIGPMMLSEAPELRVQLRNDIGSVAANADGTVIAATSPDGGVVIFSDLSGRVLGTQQLQNSTGLAPHGEVFRASSAIGAFKELGPDVSHALASLDLSFDNHLMLAAG